VLEEPPVKLTCPRLHPHDVADGGSGLQPAAAVRDGCCDVLLCR
jgi:hypothetical protein